MVRLQEGPLPTKPPIHAAGPELGHLQPITEIRPATPADLPAVLSLLATTDLTAEGVPGDLAGFVVAEAGDVVGVAGLERYGDAALLRSVAVAPAMRGAHVARRMVQMLEETAGREGTCALYLLTLTAEAYFHRLGFETVNRDTVPVAVRASVEFRGACPDTAVVMYRRLEPQPGGPRG